MTLGVLLKNEMRDSSCPSLDADPVLSFTVERDLIRSRGKCVCLRKIALRAFQQKFHDYCQEKEESSVKIVFQ